MNKNKRLTRKDEKGRWVADAGHFCVYHDDKLPSAADMMYGNIVDRLAELEDMTEKIGEHSLPVGIGDTVYYVYFYGGYIELKICRIIFSKFGVSFVGRSDSGRETEFFISAFETNVVFTEEEAQKKSEEWSR